MDEKFENDRISDCSDDEQGHATRQIKEKLDGLAEYQVNLPLSRIRYNYFEDALSSIKPSLKYEQIFRELLLKLQNDPDWRNDDYSDFDGYDIPFCTLTIAFGNYM